MYKDIDKLMRKMRISALFADGNSRNDATMYYLLRGAHITGCYVKKRGKPAYVIHSPIEREVARETGHRLISLNRYNIRTIYGKHRDPQKAYAAFLNVVLNDLDIRGNVSFYGLRHMGNCYYLMRHLMRMNRRVKIHQGVGRGVISFARETKDKREVERIKRVRSGVIYAFNHMVNAVRTMRVRKNTIMKDRKRALRISDLKAMLRKALFDRKLVDSTGMIVAQGRDAGVPHNTGRDGEAVRLGKTIVLDIFPQEADGGYFFDFTRTICFGFAPKTVVDTYRTVRDAQDYAMSLLAVGKGCRTIEQSICAFFEKRGHPTFLSTPKTQRGYCHSLGHGLGLDVHEIPSFNLLKNNTHKIRPGHVFTVEPGLYYPDKGYGIRLEDVVYVNPRGKIENLTRCARKLIIEM